MPLRLDEQMLEDNAESGVAELAFATGEKDRRPCVKLLQPCMVVRIDLRSLATDIPPELVAGLG